MKRRLMTPLVWWTVAFFVMFAIQLNSADVSGGITLTGNVNPSPAGSDPWAIAGDLYVGQTADANMVLDGTSSVSNTNGWIAYGSGIVADANVIGANATWTNSGNLYVGHQGDGALDVSGGGNVTSVNGYVARAASGIGEAVITGAGSTWQNDAYLYVGYEGTGGMLVSGGGSVSDYYGSIGDRAGSYGLVRVTGTGSTWSNTDYLFVGNEGDADLEIADGGQVTSCDGAVAFMPGSTGSVQVTGSGSTWTVQDLLTVGTWGQGEMEILAGGRVNCEEGYIGGFDPFYVGDEVDAVGYDPNGTGQVLVSGSGSTWDVSDWLYVGFAGDGDMEIAEGGAVSDAYGIVGCELDSCGVVTVTGANSSWTNTLGLGVGVGGEGHLVVRHGGLVTSVESGIGGLFGSGGTVLVTDTNSTFTNTEELAVGGWGTGGLRISNGGRVTNTDAYIGGLDLDAINPDVSPYSSDVGGTGRVTVTGAGSRWDSDGFLYVGYTGTGILDVHHGGVVTSVYGGVGTDANSVGMVWISDAGSQWSLSEALAVGAYGQGTLTVANGGAVDANEVYVGGFDMELVGEEAAEEPHGAGTIAVTGTGSQLSIADFLYVGYTGTGTLDVNDGGLVTSVYGGVGTDVNGVGTVEVSDAGSQWNMSEALAVGAYGQGTLTVGNGGAVDANEAYVGGFDMALVGEGAAEEPNGTGTVTVTGTGSALTIDESLYIGYTGTGALDVNDGALLEAGDGTIGYLAGATGRATVSGTDSLWRTGDLQVGYVGDGTLLISDGGAVDVNEVVVGAYDTGSLLISNGGTLDANAVWVGQAQNASGAATVTGSGSRWDANDVWIGGWGQGELTVSNGGEVADVNAMIGSLWSSTGAVTVTSGSSWETQGTLQVGYNGSATMVVSGHSVVSSGVGMIAANVGSTGAVTVTGAQSVWNIDGGLYVGGSDTAAGGTGVLDVNDLGIVMADEVRIWETGTLSGDGTVIASTVTNSGTMAPGNSIGTMTIDGDLTMEPNSVLEVEVDSSGNSDLLHVTGDVDIQGGTVKAVATETLRGTLDYTILDANSVTGTFDTLDTALLSVTVQTAELGYDSNAVTLEIEAANFSDPNLLTRNQVSLGAALDEVVAPDNAVTSALQGVGTERELRGHYDQLSGHTRPSLAPVTVAGTARFMGAVSGRLRAPGAANALGWGTSGMFAMAGPDAGADARAYDRRMNGTDFALGNGTPYFGDRRWGVWGKGYGLFGDADGEPEAPGYDYTVYGAAFGLDYQWTKTLLLGVTTGYSDGDVDYENSRNSSDLSATTFGFYGRWDMQGAYLDGLLTYSDLEYETRRYVDLMDERLDGDLDGSALTGYVETGFDWCSYRNWLMQPLAAFQFARLDLDEYTESGGDSALGYDDQSYESYKSSLGMKWTRDLLGDAAEERFAVQLRARWVHEFGDTESVVDTYFASDPATVFAVRNDEIARDSAVLGAGLNAQLGRSTRWYADYDVRLNRDDTAHLISAGLQYRW